MKLHQYDDNIYICNSYRKFYYEIVSALTIGKLLDRDGQYEDFHRHPAATIGNYNSIFYQ